MPFTSSKYILSIGNSLNHMTALGFCNANLSNDWEIPLHNLGVCLALKF